MKGCRSSVGPTLHLTEERTKSQTDGETHSSRVVQSFAEAEVTPGPGLLAAGGSGTFSGAVLFLQKEALQPVTSRIA